MNVGSGEGTCSHGLEEGASDVIALLVCESVKEGVGWDVGGFEEINPSSPSSIFLFVGIFGGAV